MIILIYLHIEHSLSCFQSLKAKQFCRLYEHIKNDKYLVGQRLVNYNAVKDMNITVATQYGRIDRVAELIAAGGVDINQPDAEGCYLMHWAAINNRVDLIK